MDCHDVVFHPFCFQFSFANIQFIIRFQIILQVFWETTEKSRRGSRMLTLWILDFVLLELCFESSSGLQSSSPPSVTRHLLRLSLVISREMTGECLGDWLARSWGVCGWGNEVMTGVCKWWMRVSVSGGCGCLWVEDAGVCGWRQLIIDFRSRECLVWNRTCIAKSINNQVSWYLATIHTLSFTTRIFTLSRYIWRTSATVASYQPFQTAR